MEKSDIGRLHATEKLGNRSWGGSTYYDYPDGEDLMGKLWFTTKVVGLSSFIIGIWHSKSYPAPTTNTARWIRIAKFVGPCLGMGITFTCVTYYSTVLRKKDDTINYAIGGATAGLLLGPAIGIPALSFWGAFTFAVLGVLQKHANMDGRSMLPGPFERLRTKHPQSYYLRDMDWTLAPEIKGNWAKYAKESGA